MATLLFLGSIFQLNRSLDCSYTLDLYHSRIIEVEWAVKNNTAFIPSPKLRKKTRTRTKNRRKIKAIVRDSDAEDEAPTAVDVNADGAALIPKSKMKHRKCYANEFGVELTNVDNQTNTKRPHSPVKGGAAEGVEEGSGETPPKRQRRGTGKLIVVESSNDEDSEWTSPRKSKRRILA
ncbi:hypothetical protein AMATHDRAFT_5328 [Amanita thiersii Skay4041]|uniref:Uncharacterized protein n=1 Tax=Amanita thiersii Skay4041 TaxID=703135 RepID=A0A2A9NL23_9AGAR|nr:hypothetical protein AMATHDRAFT_5328 [Amanita thiersii Skay4041]